jgi:hypothetical protein
MSAPTCCPATRPSWRRRQRPDGQAHTYFQLAEAPPQESTVELMADGVPTPAVSAAVDVEELGLGLPRCLSHMRSCLRVATSHAHLITNSTRTIEDLHGARILHSTRVCRLKKLRASTAHTTSRNGVARNKAQARVQRPTSGAAKPPSNGHERL